MEFVTTVLRRVVLVGAATLLASCSPTGSEKSEIRTVAAGRIPPGTNLPAPSDKPVLVLRGEGLRTNVTDGVALDLAGLGSLPLVEVTVDDPWDKRPVRYEGVLTSELLTAVGAPAGAKTVTITALDDYRVTLSADELRSGKVLVAIRADGNVLPVDDGGPTKIIFLPGSKEGANKDLWIWSLRDMVVQ